MADMEVYFLHSCNQKIHHQVPIDTSILKVPITFIITQQCDAENSSSHTDCIVWNSSLYIILLKTWSNPVLLASLNWMYAFGPLQCVTRSLSVNSVV